MNTLLVALYTAQALEINENPKANVLMALKPQNQSISAKALGLVV